MSLIFISYALFVLLCDFGPIPVWNDQFINVYRKLDILFAVFAVFSLLFFWLYKQDNRQIQNYVTKTVLFLVIIWSAIVSGIELTSLGFSALILLMLVAVFFVNLNLRTSILHFTSALVALMVTLYFQEHLNKTVIPSLLMIIPVIIISIILAEKSYQSKINALYDSIKLKELNNELQTIKEHLEEKVEKRTTELSVAKEKAEESDRLKSAFLANMSHEIRTPMNGILGFSELLKEPNLTGEEQKKYISIIEKGGERMLNIINNLIDMSKIESGQMEVFLSETNINKQIEYIHTFFKPEAARKGLQLNVLSLLSEKDATIATDREKLYAILTNLVKNAIKYCDDGVIEFGCEIYPKEKSVNIPSTTSKSLQFFVKDTGIGIAKDRQEAIFERFIQADIADIQPRQGAGLGLSISRSYVEMLGGKMWLESNADEEGGKKGTTFYFTIPFVSSSQDSGLDEKSALEKLPGKLLKKLQILVAEDDDASAILLGITVKSMAAKIIRARTGTETVEICRQNQEIDLILMDIRMPEMNGYEATRQIRQFNLKTIIVAQTAFALAGDKEKALEAGCNDYISKPLREDLLKEILIRHFDC